MSVPRPRWAAVWLPTLLAGGVCAVVAAIVSGADGLWAGVAGTVVVVVFFASSPLALGPVTKVSPQLSLLVAMIFFATKVVALVALMVVLLDPHGLGAHLDERALGVTVILTTLVWTAFAVRAATQARLPLYDLGNSPRNTPDTLK